MAAVSSPLILQEKKRQCSALPNFTYEKKKQKKTTTTTRGSGVVVVVVKKRAVIVFFLSKFNWRGACSYLVEFLLDVPDVILFFGEVVQVEIVTGS